MFRGFGQGWGLLQADLIEPFLLQFYALSGDYPTPGRRETPFGTGRNTE